MVTHRRHLKQVQEQIGFRYLRFHGLLHDDMFVLRENENGEMINETNDHLDRDFRDGTPRPTPAGR